MLTSAERIVHDFSTLRVADEDELRRRALLVEATKLFRHYTSGIMQLTC